MDADRIAVLQAEVADMLVVGSQQVSSGGCKFVAMMCAEGKAVCVGEGGGEAAGVRVNEERDGRDERRSDAPWVVPTQHVTGAAGGFLCGDTDHAGRRELLDGKTS